VKIAFLDRGSLPIPSLGLEAFGELACHEATREDEVIERAKDATVVITNKVPLRAAALAALPALRMIAVPATGLDHIDLDCCRARRIAVRNCEGYSEIGIAEHVFALMLALRRNLIGFRRDLIADRWAESPHFALFTRSVTDVHGQTLGVIGRGRLGQSTARLADALSMKVLFAERKGATALRPGYTAFDEVLERSDVVSLHCPLTPETRSLIGARELALMKPTSILVNTARGALVDNAALLDALRHSRIGGAGLDVVDTEPPPRGHCVATADLPNLIVTPHVSWASSSSLVRLREMLIAHLQEFISSKGMS
jgi:glycerate dehydrogenase